MNSRSACSFGSSDFGIDVWPKIVKTPTGAVTSNVGGPSASTRVAGTSSSVRSRATAKVSERGETAAIRPTPRMRLRPSASASALLQVPSTVAGTQEPMDVTPTRDPMPEKPTTQLSAAPGVAPSEASARLYQPPHTTVSPVQGTGRGYWVFVEDLGRFEKAISDRSLGMIESNQLLAELSTIQRRERGELQVCQAVVDSREEVFKILHRRLSRKAKATMQKLWDEDSEGEDGDTTIKGVGDGDGDRDEEDAQGDPNPEASGSGERIEAMEE